ncbi:MAG TPA: dienelactone hydrolase family protein [Arenimonas sp.]|uniref:dienelactone hydrolase family protein n=1 Tax=Arenimonas sp. TaxID=1872635 RepID=UPI002D808049|nr:dienelactone hydrolase family protein [Arenimonas sp.]HEU0152017.1 dienelactone hydrolase family protein [Arenimonas sp.]
MRALIALALLALGSTAVAKPVAEPVSWTHGGTTFDGYLVYDADEDDRRPGLVMVPNWMGVTDAAVEKAKQLAADDYVILLVDMYGRGVRPANADEAGKAAGAVYADREALRGRINAALDVLKGSSAKTPLDAAQLGGIGFCFGGAVVLDLARSGADVAGVVSFHGNLSTSIPAQPGDVKASLLVLNGADDGYVPAEQIATFQQEMTAAKADWQFVNYAGAVHCFAEADANSPGCQYQPLAAKRAYAAMESFFDEKFGD